MVHIQTVAEMQALSERLRSEGRKIGFVPTMGCLHEGHASLIRIAAKLCDETVVSIFVNPTQFGAGEDLDRYPRDLERDEKICTGAGARILFRPAVEEMYPEGYSTFVTVDRVTTTLCGSSRPGHFRGVATVCAKLFNTVKPHIAVFGEKDFQQVVVIRRMVQDLDFDLKIVTGPIVREADGLAMSSRNAYLSPEERKNALCLNESLGIAEKVVSEGEREAKAILSAVRKTIEAKKRTRIDYVELVHPDTLEPVPWVEGKTLLALAVYVGKTRLIDNRMIGGRG